MINNMILSPDFCAKKIHKPEGCGVFHFASSKEEWWLGTEQGLSKNPLQINRREAPPPFCWYSRWYSRILSKTITAPIRCKRRCRTPLSRRRSLSPSGTFPTVSNSFDAATVSDKIRPAAAPPCRRVFRRRKPLVEHFTGLPNSAFSNFGGTLKLA